MDSHFIKDHRSLIAEVCSDIPIPYPMQSNPLITFEHLSLYIQNFWEAFKPVSGNLWHLKTRPLHQPLKISAVLQPSLMPLYHMGASVGIISDSPVVDTGEQDSPVSTTGVFLFCPCSWYRGTIFPRINYRGFKNSPVASTGEFLLQGNPTVQCTHCAVHCTGTGVPLDAAKVDRFNPQNNVSNHDLSQLIAQHILICIPTTATQTLVRFPNSQDGRGTLLHKYWYDYLWPKV